MRGIGRESRGTLQLDTGGFQRRFRPLSLGAVFLRRHNQGFDRRGEPPRDKMAADEPDYEQTRAGEQHMLPYLLLSRDGVRKRVKSYFIGGRKRRAGIQLFIKQKVRNAAVIHCETPFVGAWRCHNLLEPAGERDFLDFGQCRQIKSPTNPDTAFYLRVRVCSDSTGLNPNTSAAITSPVSVELIGIAMTSSTADAPLSRAM